MEPECRALLETLERQLLDPDIRADRDRTAALLADDFIEFGSSGRIFDKNRTIDGLARAEHAPRVTRSLHDFRVRVLAEDVALATYVATRHAPGMPPVSTLRSSLWRHDAGRWRMTFHQGTPTRAVPRNGTVPDGNRSEQDAGATDIAGISVSSA